MKSKSTMFILIVVILLVVGALVYFFVLKEPSNPETIATSGLVSTNTGQSTGSTSATTGSNDAGNQVVVLLRNLSTIRLDDAIFKTPGFALLRDISINLPPVTNQGRRNPFAPVGGDAVTEVVIPTAVTAIPAVQ